ncbi:MAG: hypothetical protein MJ252_28715 [archaeon]|nr:hypothetical protein [archaeon]
MISYFFNVQTPKEAEEIIQKDAEHNLWKNCRRNYFPKAELPCLKKEEETISVVDISPECSYASKEKNTSKQYDLYSTAPTDVNTGYDINSPLYLSPISETQTHKISYFPTQSTQPQKPQEEKPFKPQKKMFPIGGRKSKNKFSAIGRGIPNSVMNYYDFYKQNAQRLTQQMQMREMPMQTAEEKQNVQLKYKQKKLKDPKVNCENILRGLDQRTTLMLRNIPNKYTIKEIVDEIGSEFWGKYDCLSLPMDHETKLNLGYAFINFTSPLHILSFYSKLNSHKWKMYRSEKILDISYAVKQGKKDISLKSEYNYFPENDVRFNFTQMKPTVEIPMVRNIFINFP